MRTLCWSLVCLLLMLHPVLAEDSPRLFLSLDLPFAGLQGRTAVDDVNDRGQLVVNDVEGPKARLVELRDGSLDVTTIACPGAEDSTAAKSVNNRGDVVGFCTDAAGTQGFLRRASGALTFLNAPGALSTNAIGVNDARQVVGDFRDATGTHGFFFQHGFFIPFDVPLPGVVDTFATAINNQGKIIGFTLDATGRAQGWVLDQTGFQALVIPDALDTVPLDLNDQGQLVGVYTDQSEGLHSFVRDGAVFTTLDLQAPGPLVLFTDVSGVNNRGQLAGRVVLVLDGDPPQIFHWGFLASLLPEEPSPALAQAGTRRTAQAPTPAPLRLGLAGWPHAPRAAGTVLPAKLMGR